MLFSNRVTFGGVTMVTFDLSTTFRNFGLVQTGVRQKDSDAMCDYGKAITSAVNLEGKNALKGNTPTVGKNMC